MIIIAPPLSYFMILFDLIHSTTVGCFSLVTFTWNSSHWFIFYYPYIDRFHCFMTLAPTLFGLHIQRTNTGVCVCVRHIPVRGSAGRKELLTHLY